MKRWTVRIRKVDKPIFNRIKSGSKTIETRALNDPDSRKGYYGKISKGDIVTFLCDGERLEKSVTSVRKYRTFDNYLESEDLKNILGPGSTPDIARKIHYGFPGYKERLEKYGIVAFDIK